MHNKKPSPVRARAVRKSFFIGWISKRKSLARKAVPIDTEEGYRVLFWGNYR